MCAMLDYITGRVGAHYLCSINFSHTSQHFLDTTSKVWRFLELFEVLGVYLLGQHHLHLCRVLVIHRLESRPFAKKFILCDFMIYMSKKTTPPAHKSAFQDKLYIERLNISQNNVCDPQRVSIAVSHTEPLERQ